MITEEIVFEQLQLNGDGAGGIKGAHYVEIALIKKDGIIINTRLLPPVPLPLNSALLTEKLGTALNAAVLTNQAKGVEIDVLKAAAKPNEDALAAASAQVAALTAQLAALQPPVNSFSRKAIKVALSDAGLLDQFEATISSPQDSVQKLAMIVWEEDDTFTQTSPALVLTFSRMKLTNEQITAIFVAAAKL